MMAQIKEFNVPSDTVAEFADLVEELHDVDANQCYQCRKCTSGCPLAHLMDYTPAQVIHAVRLGLKDLVLNSNTFWLCIACGTCFYICPTGAITIQEVEEGQKARVPEGEEVTGPARVINNWKVGLVMKRCKKCGEIIAPEFQLEYLRKKVNLPEGHFDICPSCRE